MKILFNKIRCEHKLNINDRIPKESYKTKTISPYVVPGISAFQHSSSCMAGFAWPWACIDGLSELGLYRIGCFCISIQQRFHQGFWVLCPEFHGVCNTHPSKWTNSWKQTQAISFDRNIFSRKGFLWPCKVLSKPDMNRPKVSVGKMWMLMRWDNIILNLNLVV